MVYRELGNTGMRVSEIGMGCEGFLAVGPEGYAPFVDLMEELGINCIDMYTPNPEFRSCLGEALKGRRNKFILQGHICSVWKDGQYLRTRELPEAKTAFQDQLDRLQTDYMDIGMIHYCDSLSDWEDLKAKGILDYARELKAQGVIRAIGLSSHNPQVGLQAVREGAIEVLMFSINPCYDLLPANEDVEELWNEKNYENALLNMDPERQALYELCQQAGVGITVMKAFGGGDLLNAELSPAGVALTSHQCIHYALSRPGVASVMAGARTLEDLQRAAAYEEAPDEEKDYAPAFASMPKISWSGHCMYCSHCAPCPMEISVADVTKYYHLAEAGIRASGLLEDADTETRRAQIPETVREHYKALEHHAGECIACGSCESRCPFSVSIIENMRRAAELFGY